MNTTRYPTSVAPCCDGGLICHDFKATGASRSGGTRRSRHLPGRLSVGAGTALARLEEVVAATAAYARGLTPATARLIRELAAWQEALLREQGMWDLFQDIELLARLARHGADGYRLDCYRLGELTAKL